MAAERFCRDYELSLIEITNKFKDLPEQVNLVNKMVDVVDKSNRDFYVLLLQYNVEKPQSFYAQVQIFAKRKEEVEFEPIVNKTDEYIFQFIVMKRLDDNILRSSPSFGTDEK